MPKEPADQRNTHQMQTRAKHLLLQENSEWWSDFSEKWGFFPERHSFFGKTIHFFRKPSMFFKKSSIFAENHAIFPAVFSCPFFQLFLRLFKKRCQFCVSGGPKARNKAAPSNLTPKTMVLRKKRGCATTSDSRSRRRPVQFSPSISAIARFSSKYKRLPFFSWNSYNVKERGQRYLFILTQKIDRAPII